MKIEKNSVQETLLIPLYGRKLCNKRFPNLFQDTKVESLLEKIDYDFSEFEKKESSMMYQFGALEVAMRQTDLMCEIRAYLEKHPMASVVNLGCGLDLSGENCDNGQCKIYNIDFPDVIAVRNELLPETDRIQNIAADLNDTNWFTKIDKTNGVVFVAAGVFYYFKREQIKVLFQQMEDTFPGCWLVFDTANQRAVKIMLKTWVKDAGVTSIKEYFAVNDIANDLQSYLPNTTIQAKGYMLGYNDLKDPSVPKLFRVLAKIGDGFMGMQIIRLEFHS